MVRGHLTRKKHRPRYKGIVKIRALENNLAQMEQVTAQLKKDKDGARKNIENLRNSIKSACATIKVRIVMNLVLKVLDKLSLFCIVAVL